MREGDHLVQRQAFVACGSLRRVVSEARAVLLEKPRQSGGSQLVRLRMGAGMRPPRLAKTALESCETGMMGARPSSPP